MAGLIGLHAATACLFDDQTFGVAMGSWFDYHPTIQEAVGSEQVSGFMEAYLLS